MAEDLVEVDEFTPAVTAPEDGDDRDAESVVQGFQPLANRTRWLSNRAGIGPDGTTHVWPDQHSFTNNVGFAALVRLTGAANELEYADAAGMAAPRTRTVVVPMPSMQAYAMDNGWWGGGVWGASCLQPNIVLRVPLHVPADGLLLSFKIKVLQAHAGTGNSRLSVTLYRRTPNGMFDDIVDTICPAYRHSGTPGVWEILTMPADPSYGQGRPSSIMYAEIYSSSVAAGDSPDMVSWMEMTFRDPGPRNY
jgi:hypothetical protein